MELLKSIILSESRLYCFKKFNKSFEIFILFLHIGNDDGIDLPFL